ncbi:hypothetical protein IE81DRAFT_22087 [Ceraceosorus guamensis]|uniref:Uncharacterized protein n=1 Tax=Ceraceosorus guamensis TaxID=1522189 RepID=A0A316VPP4_9BASI|nr:hypothetical protein IE81DRAFT_22087 [Ceraceosorus guamensis]PWN39547.1 hypothetical protein IE81DRAFT_22087 [Ceraceosorus guamensis]
MLCATEGALLKLKTATPPWREEPRLHVQVLRMHVMTDEVVVAAANEARYEHVSAISLRKLYAFAYFAKTFLATHLVGPRTVKRVLRGCLGCEMLKRMFLIFAGAPMKADIVELRDIFDVEIASLIDWPSKVAVCDIYYLKSTPVLWETTWRFTQRNRRELVPALLDTNDRCT